METLITEILGGASGFGAYSLVLFVLLLCGLGLPLPEDVVLITGGYLVFTGTARLEVMLAVTYLGILGGDSIAFGIGHHFGRRLEAIWPFRLFITPAKRAKVERLFQRYGDKIVMVARFMPGVRAVTYFIAGGARMKYRRFLLYDGIAALASAPLFVLLGNHFGSDIEALVKAVRQGQWAVVAGLVALVAAVVAFKVLRGRRARRREQVPAEVARLVSVRAATTPQGPSPQGHSTEARAAE